VSDDGVRGVSKAGVSYGSGVDEAGTSDGALACEVPLASRPDGATPRQQPLSATSDDVTVERGEAPAVSVRMAASWSPTDTNAQRTSARAEGTYAEAGVTSSGDAAYAGVALAKGRSPNRPTEVEGLSASVQVGLQSEAQAGLVRAGGASASGASWGAEGMTARASIGIHNPDGTHGLNPGATAAAAAFEGTTPPLLGGHVVLTGGVALGFGAAGSVGYREADGQHEVRARAEVGPYIVGLALRF
jgi:hypothetical protein